VRDGQKLLIDFDEAQGELKFTPTGRNDFMSV
jgi:hypothetical protein